MELLGYIAAVPLAAQKAGEEGGGSFLVSPGLGLMIWTLVLFLFTLVINTFAGVVVGRSRSGAATEI